MILSLEATVDSMVSAPSWEDLDISPLEIAEEMNKNNLVLPTLKGLVARYHETINNLTKPPYGRDVCAINLNWDKKTPEGWSGTLPATLVPGMSLGVILSDTNELRYEPKYARGMIFTLAKDGFMTRNGVVDNQKWNDLIDTPSRPEWAVLVYIGTDGESHLDPLRAYGSHVDNLIEEMQKFVPDDDVP